MKVEVRKAKKKDQHAIWQPEEFKAASGVVVKAAVEGQAARTKARLTHEMA